MRRDRSKAFGLGRLLSVAALSAALLATSAAPAAADHSWGGYHWARTGNPFVLGLDNNLTTANWRAIGASVSSDWSQSSVLDAPLSAPKTDNKRCKASSGRVEVCNGKYGYNGWLGVAQVWLSGGHIAQATTKVNDSYLNGSGYDNADRQHVLCQEVGHDFGLDHQDESGADLNTCMDYANDLNNPRPNAHDYEQLELIYNSHADASSSIAAATSTSGAKGRLKRVEDDLFVEDLGKGKKRVVFVFWKDRQLPHGPPAVD